MKAGFDFRRGPQASLFLETEGKEKGKLLEYKVNNKRYGLLLN